MSWHEPGRDRDPWRDPKDGPPDLDAWLRRIWGRLRKGARKLPKPPAAKRFRLWWLVPIILIGIWLVTGFYSVPANHRAVVLHFGAYAGSSGPGLHWHWPWPIGTREAVDMSEGRSLSQNAQVLTRDGQLATLRLTVAYRISDPRAYLFGTPEPARLITAFAAAALAQAARGHSLDELDSSDAGALEQSLQTRIGAELAAAGAGVAVQSVNIGHLELPQAVGDSKSELAAVKQDNDKRIEEAKKSAEQTVLAAGREASELIAAARQAARAREAQAHVRLAHFEALLPAWRKSPSLTRQMLRADALNEVFAAIPKVLVSGSVRSVTLPPWPTTRSAPAAASAQVPASAGTGDHKP